MLNEDVIYLYNRVSVGTSGDCQVRRTGMKDNKDAFDQWWEWADKPLDSMLTIPAEMHEAVMALPPDERRDRAKVNEAVRDGIGTECPRGN
jgi:hypothetical protein